MFEIKCRDCGAEHRLDDLDATCRICGNYNAVLEFPAGQGPPITHRLVDRVPQERSARARLGKLLVTQAERREGGMRSWIEAIRSDEKVGRGSCSSIDECLTDAELAGLLRQWKVTTVAQAVAAARNDEQIRNEYADDIRNS